MYSEVEDDGEWREFLQNFSMKSSVAEDDSEEEEEDDHYDQLLETDDEAGVAKQVNEPQIEVGVEEAKGFEMGGGIQDDYGPEMTDRPLPNYKVRLVDNGPFMNIVDNVPVKKVESGPSKWLNEFDFEEFFAADFVDPELFPEPEHDEQVVAEDRIKEGLQFSDKQAFQRHLRRYCVLTRTICRFKKSDNVRIKVVCKSFGEPILCPWYITARKIPGEPTWSIRDFHILHTCIGDPLGINSSANPDFVAENVIEDLRGSHGKLVPEPAEIAVQFWTKFSTVIPYDIAWKARSLILESINGSYDESFSLIPSLCEMITRTNPGSIATYTYG
ncbi:hypothetical protein MKX01_036184, partial [Papaver californicum]